MLIMIRTLKQLLTVPGPSSSTYEYCAYGL
jgi:hypothetical protein